MSLVLFIVGGAATGVLFGALARSGSRGQAVDPEEPPPREPSGEGSAELPGEGSAELPADVVRPKSAGVAFAEGIERPLWPVRTQHPRRSVVSYRGVDGKVRGNWGRRFAASRKGGRMRRHAGIDLFGFAGDAVLAMAEGTVTAVQSFSLGSWAVFVDHGAVVVMYGEVDKGSWTRLGVKVGSRVSAGQPIAEVACMVRNEEGECTSHMLHLETYVPGTTKNQSWYAGDSPPPALLDPSLLLLLAAQEATTPAGVT